MKRRAVVSTLISTRAKLSQFIGLGTHLPRIPMVLYSELLHLAHCHWDNSPIRLRRHTKYRGQPVNIDHVQWGKPCGSFCQSPQQLSSHPYKPDVFTGQIHNWAVRRRNCNYWTVKHHERAGVQTSLLACPRANPTTIIDNQDDNKRGLTSVLMPVTRCYWHRGRLADEIVEEETESLFSDGWTYEGGHLEERNEGEVARRVLEACRDGIELKMGRTEMMVVRWGTGDEQQPEE